MWDILGIEPTLNEKEITNAYRLKLLETNPEEDPEGFKQLRNAYEEALNYARNNGKKTASPIDQWVEQLEDLYFDFNKRKQLACWQELFQQDICYGIDTRSIIEERFLQFTYQNYFIPHYVWVYLNEQFDYLNRLEELYENHPENFVNYIIRDGILYDDQLPFDLFVPGMDGNAVDQYIINYRKLLNEENNEEFYPLLENSPESHLYGDILIISNKVINGDHDQIEKLKQLNEQYPQHVKVKYQYAKCALTIPDPDLAIQLTKEIIEINPTDEGGNYLLAQAYIAKKDYKSGIEKINELMSLVRGDDAKLLTLSQYRSNVNISYIEQLTAAPLNQEKTFELAWAYLQNEKFDEAIELAYTISKDDSDPFDYYNLMSYIYFEQKKYEESIIALDKLIDVIRNLTDDGSEKTKKRINRLNDMIARKADILCECERFDEARTIYENMLSDKNHIDALSSLCRITMIQKDYAKTYEYANQFVQEVPDSYTGYLYLSYAFYYLDYDREAFEAINTSMSIYSYDLRCYALKARILIRNESYEGADDILQVLEENNLTDDIHYQFIKGLLAEYRDKNLEHASEYYQKVCDMIPDNKYADFNDEAYYRLLNVKGRTLNARQTKDRAYMLDLCEKGLAYNPDHILLKDYKAWLLVIDGKYDEALPIYQYLEQLETHPLEVEKQLAYIYYQDLENKADLSLAYCKKVLEKEEDEDSYFKAGMCEMYLDHFEEALPYFTKLLEFEWDIDCYFRKSQVYAYMDQLDLAIENALKAVDCIKDRESDSSKFYTQVVHLYSRKEQYQEAIDFIMNTFSNGNYENAGQDLYDVYSQAGRYDDALKFLKGAKKQGFSNVSTRKNYFDLYASYNRKRKYEQEYTKTLFETKSNSLYQIHYNYHLLNNDFKLAISVLEDYVKHLKKEGYKDLSIEYSYLAFCYFMLGEKKLQVAYAKKAYNFLIKTLKQPYGRSKPMYYTRLAKVYALLDKFDKAKECLEKARNTPKCNFCQYCRCKDADLDEVCVLIIMGEYEKAKQLNDQNKEDWKNDYLIYAFEKILKKKVKK